MRGVLILLILFSAFNSISQKRDLYSKVYSYEDSTKILIKNSRRLILEAIKERDYSEAVRIKEFAEQNVDLDQYALFTLGEEFLISYHTQNFFQILTTFQNWDSLRNVPYYVYRLEDDQLYENLLIQSVKDASIIYKNIDLSPYGDQHKDALRIVFRSMLADDPNANILQEDLNEEVENHLDKYNSSPYAKFLKENVRLVFEDRFGYSVFLGAGFGGLNGGLSNYIENSVSALLGMEFYIKRKYLVGFKIQGGGGEISQNFNYKGDWPEGMDVNPLFLGATTGYVFTDTKRVRLAGLLELGAYLIEPIEDEKTPETEDLALNSFAYGPSVILDYYPVRVDRFLTTVRFGLRIQAGYLILNYGAKDDRFNGNYPYVGTSLVLDLFEKTRVIE